MSKLNKDLMSKVFFIAEFVMVEAHLECSTPNCRSVIGDWHTDEYDIARLAINKGWRAGRENVYCPKCAKKKLKP